MDVYLNAVFCPLAMVDKAVFEQEGWHRDADGTVSGVVYNEMQGALASPDAQLQNALERAMFPDTAYGFVSGGDPASIPALTYVKIPAGVPPPLQRRQLLHHPVRQDGYGREAGVSG